MIYEFRTYNIKPRMVPDYQKAFHEKLEGRQKLSRLAGHWYTEVGPLNQIVAVWPYESADERRRIRREAESGPDPVWPPNTGDFVVDMKSEIFLPAPFMQPLEDGDLGPIYEMRIYTYMPEDVPEVLEHWGNAVEARVKYSPMVGCWYNGAGGRDNWVHMWVYRSFEERLRIREEVKDKGVWPPPGGPAPVTQQNKIMLPAWFSPLR